MRLRTGFGFALALGAAALACSGNSSNAASPGGGGGGDQNGDAGGSNGSDGGSSSTTDSGAITDECSAGEAYCSGARTAHVCTDTASGKRWQDQPCGTGQGCVQGACVANACSDECAVGDVQGAKTCTLYDVAHDSWGSLDATGSMSDRARAYEAYLRKWEMVYGAVGSAHFTDTTYTTIDTMNGLGDASIWTGTYLASQALRLMATGSADARAEILGVVKTLDRAFHVSGEPATLARIVRPAGGNPGFALPDLNCANSSEVHCNVAYDGSNYDYYGHISRDQYQGFMLGMTLAYDALTSADEDTRAIIRNDIVALVKELMKDRTVDANITYQGVPIPVTLTMRFVVLNHAEMTGGKVAINLDTADNGQGSGMYGLQEFTPDLADIVRQLPGLSFVPSIPRSSSAMMLASFFRDALDVTDGIDASKADHDAILAYYTGHTGTGGNVTDWLNIAKQWTAGNDCGDHYYANNIAMEPMYNLARLEDDPSRKALVQNQILGGPMWTAFSTTKNSFFTFITAANVSSVASTSAPADAMSELAQFPAPPRVVHAVDHTGDAKYMPHSSSCTNQVDHTTAVDVGDRIVEDFLWQREPWGLQSGGDPNQTEPGVDYLVAYWMARKHAFTTDDDAGKCLAFH